MSNKQTKLNRFPKINYHTFLDAYSDVILDGMVIYTGYVINHGFSSPVQTFISGVVERKRYYVRADSGRLRRIILSPIEELRYQRLLNQKRKIFSF